MNIKLLLIYLIPFFVYTQGYWERFTPIPAKGILEILMLLLTIFYFRPKNKKSVLLFLSIIVVGFISAFATGTIVEFFKFIRFLFYSYVIIDVLQQCSFSILQFGKLFKYFVFLVLLQGFASFLQVFVLQDRVEGYVGMMSSLGGTTAATFPLLIVGICVVVFCFSNIIKRRWYVIMLLVLASVILLGYSSGKRVIYIILPLIIFLGVIICLGYARYNKIKLSLKKIWIIIIICLLCLPMYFYGIKNSEGYEKELTGGETNTEILTKMFEYVNEYETAEMEGLTVGRSNTTALLLNETFANMYFFKYGKGFQSEKDENVTSQMGVGYGFVGLTRDLFAGGFLFAILTIIFLFHLILRKDYEINDAFSKSLRTMLVFVFIFVHFFYSADFTLSLKITCVLALIISFSNSKYYCHIKEYGFKTCLIHKS